MQGLRHVTVCKIRTQISQSICIFTLDMHLHIPHTTHVPYLIQGLCHVSVLYTLRTPISRLICDFLHALQTCRT
jgi:hypothetical protein